MQAQKTSVFWLLTALIYSALLMYASLVRPESLPDSKLISYDKLLHFIAYAVEAFLLAKAFVKNLYIHLLAITVFCFVLGVAIEWGQAAMQQGRSYEYTDIAANTLGIVFGAFVYLKQLNLQKWISH